MCLELDAGPLGEVQEDDAVLAAREGQPVPVVGLHVANDLDTALVLGLAEEVQVQDGFDRVSPLHRHCPALPAGGLLSSAC